MNNRVKAALKHKVFKRGMILLTYLAMLAAFLYFSKIRDYFFPDCTLRIYTYVDNFSSECIKEFEQKFNVKVSVRYFDSNEELFAKFKINRGSGYDLITPSDYMVELLRKEELLQELDHSKLPVLDELDSRLMNRYFDPENRYSLPLMWIPYGIIFHKSLFREQPKEISLSILFQNPALLRDGLVRPYRICMVDDSREAIFLASLYLYGNLDNFSRERLAAIQKLLIKQKHWVESYVNQDLRYYLLSGLVRVALAPAVFVRKILEESNDFGFLIPKEGSALSIENIAIPRTSDNADIAHKFINFILSREIAFKNSSAFGFNPTNARAYADLDPAITQNRNIFPDDALFSRLFTMHNNISIKEFEKVWLAVKSA